MITAKLLIDRIERSHALALSARGRYHSRGPQTATGQKALQDSERHTRNLEAAIAELRTLLKTET